MRYRADFLLSFSAQKERKKKKYVVSACSNDNQRKTVLFLFLVSFVVCCMAGGTWRDAFEMNEWMNRICSRQFHAASCNTAAVALRLCAFKKKTHFAMPASNKICEYGNYLLCAAQSGCTSFAFSTICDSKIMRRKIVCKWIILHTIQYFFRIPIFMISMWDSCVCLSSFFSVRIVVSSPTHITSSLRS